MTTKTWPWPEEACTHDLPRVECPYCTPQIEPVAEAPPPWWSRIFWSVRRELGGPEAIIFTGLRIVLGSMGLLTGKMTTLYVHAWLGHVISGISFLVLMLGLWGLIIPFERGILGPVVRRIRARWEKKGNRDG